MEQQVTIKDVITFSVNDLKSLAIPVELIPTIGVVVARVAANLDTCLKAITMNEEKAKSPEVTVEEVGELPDNVVPINGEGGVPNEEN